MASDSNGEAQMREVAAKLRTAANAVQSAQREALTGIGVQGLAYLWEDYRVMALGGMSPQGISWTPDTIAAIATRLMKRKAGAELLRKLPPGKGKSKNRAAIIYRACTDPTYMPKFYAKVQAEFAKHEVGVDTGRQVNSLKFGMEGNVFQQSPDTVTYGTEIAYADHYHALRPIVPPDFSAERVKAMEQLAADIFDKAQRRALSGVSNGG